jgi:hypothetical protein
MTECIYLVYTGTYCEVHPVLIRPNSEYVLSMECIQVCTLDLYEYVLVQNWCILVCNGLKKALLKFMSRLYLDSA